MRCIPVAMTPTMPTEVRARLQSLLQNATQSDLPLASAAIVSEDRELFHHEAFSSMLPAQARADETVFWLASCTKLVTAIACMQLVEQGKLRLDDGEHLETLCPHLRSVQVIGSDGSLAEKERKITLRMLLTHTAGFGYSFINRKLESGNYDEFSGLQADFDQPLVNQPGERFEYGINMDWAGMAVERATQSKLGDYTKTHIFEPLGIEDLTFSPPQEMKNRVAGMWRRTASGNLEPRPYPLEKPLTEGMAFDGFHSGGAGLWGTVRDYSKILGALLNKGVSPLTGNAILRPGTVDMIFENQLSHDPDFARRELPAVKPQLVHPAKELYPLCPHDEPQGWGLGFMISPGVTGRSATTGHWTGLSNCFWWCDRDLGVAGIVASQVLPFADLQAVQLWAGVESAVYESLEQD